MPTTLLGMVDASVGIKVAVNYKRKNGVGHFFSPSHTFVDTSFLPTVSYPDVVSGCGEIMKAALVHDGTLFDLMEAHGARLIDKKFVDDPVADDVIKRSVDTMLECIGPDLWEESLLRPMDYGHSFSRTLETTEAFKLRHGEAVAIDCIMNSMIANDKGLLSDADADRVLDLYKTLGLPCSIEGITAETYKRAAREITVHRDGILRAPLPNGIGKCAYTDEMTDDEIERAFAKLSKFIDAHPETKWDPSKSFAADRES
jgi:3-dehydroquinate synthase